MSDAAVSVLAFIGRIEDDAFAERVVALGRQAISLPEVETRWALRGGRRRLTLRMDDWHSDLHMELTLPVEQRNADELAEWASELRYAASELHAAGRVDSPKVVARQDAVYRAAGGMPGRC